LRNNFARSFRLDVSRTAGIEIESEQVRTGIGACQGIFQIGNAANLYSHHD
jgi:hypothetical protein